MSKKEFSKNLNNLLDVIENSNLKENDYLITADITKNLFELFEELSKNKHFKSHYATDRQIRERKIKTDAEKIKDKKNYIVCKKCNRIVLKKCISRHQETRICSDINFSKKISYNHKDKKYIDYKSISLCIEKQYINIIDEKYLTEDIGMYNFYN